MKRFNKSNARTRRIFDYQRLEPRSMLSVNAPNIGAAFHTQLVDGFRDADLEVLDAVRDYLNNETETQYLQSGSSNLRAIEVKYGLASTTTRFQQTINDIPVHNAIVTINQGPNGEFQRVFHNLAFENVDTPLFVSADFDLDFAEQSAMVSAGVTETFAETRGEVAWYVDDNGQARKVWDLTVFGHNPVGDFLTLVDVQTGDVLFQENRADFIDGTGDVYDPNPYQTQGNGTGLADNNDANNAMLEAQLISVTLQGLDDGTGLLIGEFVDLATLNSPDITDTDADEPSRIYEYTRDDERFEQVVVYYSVDQMNRYFHALGFDDDTGTPNGIRDFPTLANAHWFTADNSFYSLADDAIHFGDGGVDDAEDGDIVAHEYGHAVQHNQNAGWGGGEMGAMGEGFGDYLAASFYADFGDPAFQALHAAAVGEWDATSYSSDNPPNLRRVDGNKMYPGDLGGGVHADGEIWSRALWDLRNNTSGPWADQIILESHFTLASGALMPTAADAILLANDNLNNGAAAAQVRDPFVQRGILPPLNLVSFDSPLYEVGNPVTVGVSDANASGTINATIETADGDVEVVTLTQSASGLWVASINAEGATIVPGNGVIDVFQGTTPITVTYTDPVEGTITDNSEIFSDVVTALTIGETGRLEAVTDLWQTVDLIKAYNDPVIVAGPSSRNGAAPVNVRIRNVTPTSFEIHIDEWEYDDGRHRNPETVDYLVMEAGEFELQDGTIIVAGNRNNQTHRWSTNSLSDTFGISSEPPVILTQTITENDPTSVTTRTRRVTNTEFQIRLQEEQGQGRGVHGGETVSWIAFEQNTGQIGQQTFEAGVTGEVVNHHNFNLNFNTTFDLPPAFFANMQTYRGGDTATVRYRSLTNSNALIYVEEERSLDFEIRHNPESVGYLLIELGEILGNSTELRPSGFLGDSTIPDPGQPDLNLRVIDPSSSIVSPTTKSEDQTETLGPAERSELVGSVINELDSDEVIEEWFDGAIDDETANVVDLGIA